MAIVKETTGDTVACDGCGRTDAGPNQPLHITDFAVHDPNIGSGVQHHYCLSCAANRGLTDPVATIQGWEASPSPQSSAGASDGRSDASAPALLEDQPTA